MKPMAADTPLSDRRAYRRGLVLGLTIGELFMLIAFLLVLAIAWSEHRQKEERAAMSRLEDLRGVVAALGGREALDRILREAARMRTQIEAQKAEIVTLSTELSSVKPLRDLLAEMPANEIANAVELVRNLRAQPSLRNRTTAELAAMPDEIAQLKTDLSNLQASIPNFATAAEALKGLSPAEARERVELIRQLAAVPNLSRLKTEDLRLLTENANLVEAVRGITAAYQASTAQIGESLTNAFAGDLATWNASFDADGLIFRFEDPDALFEQGAADLRPRFRSILDSFCPRFLSILSGHADEIAEVRIEGHTSAEWRSGTGERNAYFGNMELSQARTRAVLEYCLTLPKVAPFEAWARADMVAVGMSSSHLIRDEQGIEDSRRSRRVEFRVITDAASRIGQIANEIRTK
jgi:outer membrane protein OmpA-like peptidoglycan-associated protein/prefoldin subunit 5